jgi:hypothetical protein
VIDTPAARSKMMRARWAIPLGVVDERTRCSNAACSVGSSLMTNGDLRPGMMCPPPVPPLVLIESKSSIRLSWPVPYHTCFEYWSLTSAERYLGFCRNFHARPFFEV